MKCLMGSVVVRVLLERHFIDHPNSMYQSVFTAHSHIIPTLKEPRILEEMNHIERRFT